MSANRAIVDTRIHDAFVERLVAKVRGLTIGDPNDRATVVGPLINDNQVKGALSKIERAKAEGARMLAGGPVQGRQHNIIPPHVFVDVEPHHAIAREESFGPVLPVLKARDEAHALQLANDTEYGLSSAVFTRDIERGVAFVQRLRVGMSHVNDQPIADAAYAPFGGERNSGVGRFNAEWIIDEYTRTHCSRSRRRRLVCPLTGCPQRDKEMASILDKRIQRPRPRSPRCKRAIVRPGRRCSNQTRNSLTMAGHAAFASSREMRSGTNDSHRSTRSRTMAWT
jgi:Aldehyde dehydrogenase family